MSLSLWLPSLPHWATSLVLSGSSRHIDPPRATKTASTLLLWSGFFGGRLFGEGMHISNWVSQSFCTYGPTNRLVRALLSESIGGRGIGALSPLALNNLFLNQPLPWHAVRLAFRILSTTRKCLFSLEICWSSKSIAQLIFTIKN